MTVETGALIPQQTKPGDHYVVRNANAYAAAQELAANKLVVWDNGPVYAMPGNANDPYLPDYIMGVKRERGARQPLGYTVPFSHSLDLIDKDRVGGEDIKQFLDDPDKSTERLGGLSFIRVAANMKRKAQRNIPDVIIPEEPNAMVQLYSSNGNDATHTFVRVAMALGVEPVMTSANPSGSPEHVYADQAQKFTDEAGIKLFVNWSDEDKPEKPRGSYPILGATRPKDVLPKERGAFLLLREGCFGIDILRRLLHGYVVLEAPDMKPSKYPDSTMIMKDIEQFADEHKEFSEVPRLVGAEFRLGLVAIMQWQFHHWEVRQDRDSEVISLL